MRANPIGDNNAMEAGVASTIITPPVGGWLLGPVARSTGVHDDLYAKVLVLNDGNQAVAILCLDLVGLSHAFNDELIALIRGRTHVETVLINCSHTHSSPFSMPWSFNGWKAHCEEETEWCDELRAAIPGIVEEATARMTPVSLHAARAPVKIGVNRRLMTENGIVMPPNPDGPETPWVDVLQVVEKGGDNLAVLFTYAAHPVIVHAASRLISTDYCGVTVDVIREQLGEGVLPLFAQGCSGNINGHPLRSGHAKAEDAGVKLGNAVLEAIYVEECVPIEADTFRVASETLRLPCEELPSAQSCTEVISELEEEIQKEGGGWGVENKLNCLKSLRSKIEKNQQPEVRFDITAVMLGDEWCLVAMPHEVFSDYALWMEEVSPFVRTVAWGYTNGCESYIPTDKDLELGVRGGYEAAGFPRLAAALGYASRLACRPGIEGQIKDGIRRIWSQKE